MSLKKQDISRFQNTDECFRGTGAEISMYSKILVPLDGSALAEGVLPYVRSLARATNTSVEFLRVHETKEFTAHRASPDCREYFDKVKASFSGIAEVKHTVERGNPAGMIVDFAAEHPGALIAMATHGYSGAQRWLLGSVAEKVLHAAKNDLLIVRPAEGKAKDEASLKTFVVALDGSERAEKSLPTVIGLAARLAATVLLVRVIVRLYFPMPEAVASVFGTASPDQERLWAEARAKATQYLDEKVEQLRAEGLAQVSFVVLDGGIEGVAGEILDLAAKTEGNIVVMSTHGRSGVGRWLLGSVVERVVRYSKGPVLVVRS